MVAIFFFFSFPETMSLFRAVVHVATELTFNFHVGLVCSLSPEQEGPGGVGRVCVCMCVYETLGRLKLVTHMPYFQKHTARFMSAIL